MNPRGTRLLVLTAKKKYGYADIQKLLQDTRTRSEIKKLANQLGLSIFTLLEWKRRFKHGDVKIQRSFEDALTELGHKTASEYFIANQEKTFTSMGKELGVSLSTVQNRYRDFLKKFEKEGV